MASDQLLPKELPMNRFLTTGALALTAAGLLASSAQAAGPNTCVYNPSNKNVSVKLAAGSFVELDREGNKFVTFDAFGKTVCASPTGMSRPSATRPRSSWSARSRHPRTTSSSTTAVASSCPGAPSSRRRPEPRGGRRSSPTDDIVDVVGTAVHRLHHGHGRAGHRTHGRRRARQRRPQQLRRRASSSDRSTPSLLRINGLGGSDFISGNGVFGRRPRCTCGLPAATATTRSAAA